VKYAASENLFAARSARCFSKRTCPFRESRDDRTTQADAFAKSSKRFARRVF
jgi:hypothetical protein